MKAYFLSLFFISFLPLNSFAQIELDSIGFEVSDDSEMGLQSFLELVRLTWAPKQYKFDKAYEKDKEQKPLMVRKSRSIHSEQIASIGISIEDRTIKNNINLSVTKSSDSDILYVDLSIYTKSNWNSGTYISGEGRRIETPVKIPAFDLKCRLRVPLVNFHLYADDLKAKFIDLKEITPKTCDVFDLPKIAAK